MHGLPREVVELSLLVYGLAEGAENMDLCECKWDTAAGLSESVRNGLGELMGDVLSPIKAKLLMNSVCVAIRTVAKGVVIEGTRPRGTDHFSAIGMRFTSTLHIHR